ncbi:MAG: TonB-dependent siderophore receptor [Geitlerinemataceae cyanobacterium]
MKPQVLKLSSVALLALGGALAAGDVSRALDLSPSLDVDRLAQSEAAVTITGLGIVETETGLQLTLETDGEILAGPDTSRTLGNALILEIPNTVLSEVGFEEFAPADGIALIQVSELDGDRVQIAITGSDAPPIADVTDSSASLVLNVTLGAAGSGDGGDAIVLGVTGEEDGYLVPDATTATRTDTPLRDTPQSIQVIPREIFEDQGAVGLSEVIRNASGVTNAEDDPRGQRFTIRGFDSAAVLRDGVRLTNGGTNNAGFAELANIEQVEVLKGPASILFGVLEPGGVINLVSEQPLGTPRYELGMRVGNREFFEPNIDFTGPLSADGSVRYRLNALYRTEDNIRGYDRAIERFFIAPTVAIDIGNDTDLTLELEYRDDERPGEFGLLAVGDEVADIPFDTPLNDPSDVATAESLRFGYRLEHRFDDSWKLRNSMHYNRYDTTVPTSVTSFLVDFGLLPTAFDEDTGDLFLFMGRLDQPLSNLELQTNVVGEFNTGPIEHTLLAGFDFVSFWDRGTETRTPFPPSVNSVDVLNIFDPDYSAVNSPDFDSLPLSGRSTGRTDAFGVFLQDQIQLRDDLILLAGLRFDSIYQETSNFSVLTGTTDSDREESEWTPRAGIVYQPSDDISLYASYSRSFAPSIGTTFEGGLLDAEQGEQFEVGARFELLDDNLLINLALFDIEKQNVALPDPRNPVFSVPSGTQASRGIELDIVGEILPGWNVVANYAYLDTEVTDSTDGTTGNELYNAPEHMANLWTTYEFQSGDLDGLLLGFGLNYVGERFGDIVNSYTVDEYLIANAVISYERDNWTAAVNFRNLFDEEYIEGVANGRLVEIYPGEGFTVLGSFSIRF